MAEATYDFGGITPIETPRITKSPTLRLSPQQEDIMSWIQTGSGNGLIIAVAGSGKTTTLIEGLSRMTGRVAFLAYNKRIADEIALKVANRGVTNARVSTFHAAGFRAWRQRYPGVRVDGLKSYKILDDISCPRDYKEFVAKLVGLAKQELVRPGDKGEVWSKLVDHHALDDLLTGRKPWDPKRDNDEATRALVARGINWAQNLLQKSIESAGELIDFDDQLYLPMIECLELEKFDWVLVDEAQDSNAARRALAGAMLRPGSGRLLAVGDPAQAIYGFTGADSESLDSIRQQFSTLDMPLTVSYRCPRRVVSLARTWVSHIEAADEAPEGLVTTTDYESFVGDLYGGQVDRSSAILCRKNAPLVKLAFGLLRGGIACHVEGRDIGGQVKTLARRWVTTTPLRSLIAKVSNYRDLEVARYLADRKPERAEAIEDKCETLIAVATGLLSEDPSATTAELLTWIDEIFADGDRGITLTSIHKAKGREWDRVYWLGRQRWQPSLFAQKDWQMVQETNLMYVAATRSKSVLVEVTVVDKE